MHWTFSCIPTSLMQPLRRPRRARHCTPLLLENLESRVLLTTTPVGVNLEAVSDWARSFMFVDAMKSARAFGSAATPWDGVATLDANGWPTTDFGAAVITVGSPSIAGQDVPSIAGTYHLSATGTATVSGVASNLTVTDTVYNAATNTTTADINVAAGAATLYLSFTNTQGGLQNVKLIRPGYAADTTQIFTDAFLAALAPFQTLRTMDFTQTNGNQVVNWADRALPTDALQTSSKGAAWEYAIELANETQKDLWINIPAHAGDDYVTQLATLLKNTLDSNLNVYVEYSNEVWNPGFEQGTWNNAQAQIDEAANPSVLNYDGGGNTFSYGWRRIVQQLERVENDFANVYGQSAINTTVRPVLASQIGFSDVLRDQLNFLEHFYGSPNQTIYAIAGAPYLNIGSLSNSATLTTSDVLTALQNDISGIQTELVKYEDLATCYGLHNLLYEGGIDLEGNASFLTAKLPANYDPRMGTIITNYLTALYSAGVEQLMYFDEADAYSIYGSWGLTEDIYNLTGSKYAAVAAFANGATPTVNVGTTLPAANSGDSLTLDAGSYTADQWETSGGSGDIRFPGAGSTYDYLLNSQGGTYTLSLSVGSTSTTGKIEVILDDQVVTTLTLPNTGGLSTDVTLSPLNLDAGGAAGILSAGPHTLRLLVLSSGFNIHSLTFLAVVPAPTGLVATATDDGDVSLSWNDVAAGTGYFLERSSDGVTGWTVIATTAIPGDANFDGQVNFEDFVVLSNNFGQTGGWAQGNFTSGTTVDFASFVILSNNFGASVAAGTSFTYFVDTGLQPGATYYYRLVAMSSTGASSASSEVAVETLIPVIVANVSVSSTSSTTTTTPTPTPTPTPTRIPTPTHTVPTTPIAPMPAKPSTTPTKSPIPQRSTGSGHWKVKYGRGW